MKKFNFKEIFEEEIKKIGLGWDIKGIIDSNKRIYVIPNDTKLISKVLELITTPMVLDIAKKYKIKVIISDRQTVYPVFTLILSDGTYLAVDIKSTYRKNSTHVAGFTLGSYTGYLRIPTKNIMFSYDKYKEHWVLGFIYTRGKENDSDIVPLSKIDEINPVIEDIEIIVQEKYKIASTRPGSGNTANIGSITEIETLRKGNGPFTDLGHEIFEDYWRNFLSRKIAIDRRIDQPYNNFEKYLIWKKAQKRLSPK